MAESRLRAFKDTAGNMTAEAEGQFGDSTQRRHFFRARTQMNRAARIGRLQIRGAGELLVVQREYSEGSFDAACGSEKMTDGSFDRETRWSRGLSEEGVHAASFSEVVRFCARAMQADDVRPL